MAHAENGPALGVEAADLGGHAAPRPRDRRPLACAVWIALTLSLGGGTQVMAWRLGFDRALGVARPIPPAAVLPVRGLAGGVAVAIGGWLLLRLVVFLAARVARTSRGRTWRLPPAIARLVRWSAHGVVGRAIGALVRRRSWWVTGVAVTVAGLGAAVALAPSPARALRVLATGLVLAAAALLARRRTRWVAPTVAFLALVVGVASLGPLYAPWRLVEWQARWYARADARPYLGWGWGTAGLLGCLAVTAARLVDRRRRSHPASGSHGTAAWGTGAELAGPHGALLGRVGDQLLRDPGEGLVLTVAPGGSGKGVSSVIPNLLDHPGGVLVNDPKGENYAVTARRRRERGQRVVALDPFGIVGGSDTFNPLDVLDTNSPDAIDDARELADMLVIPSSKGDDEGDDHWNPEASDWLTGLILYVAAHEPPELRTLTRVRALHMLAPDAFTALLVTMQASPACGGLIAAAANGLLAKADKEMSGVRSTAKRHTNFLASPRMARALGTSTIDFTDLKRGTLSVYLVLPFNRAPSYKRWARLMIACAFRAVVETPGKPVHRVLALVDEFPALGRMEPIVRAVRELRGFGLRCWLVVQDLPTLRATYGELSGALLAAADVMQAYGVNDLETARMLSELTGDATIQVESDNESAGVSQGRNGSAQRGAAVTVSEKARRLLDPAEVRRLPRGEQLLFVKGQRPIRAERLSYLTDPMFAGQFDPNPQHEAVRP